MWERFFQKLMSFVLSVIGWVSCIDFDSRLHCLILIVVVGDSMCPGKELTTFNLFGWLMALVVDADLLEKYRSSCDFRDEIK
jgi:hypothetical protein